MSNPAPTPSATIILLRERAHLEVFLARRNSKVNFGGLFVFPGGAIEEPDAKLADQQNVDTTSNQEWPENLYRLAAIRELYEETGILLASDANSSAEDLTNLREKKSDFNALCQQHNWRLQWQELYYFSRWVTPKQAPRRYDTRFFICHVQQESHCQLDGKELIECHWISPLCALKKNETGVFPMIRPTLHTLQQLTKLQSIDQLPEFIKQESGQSFFP